MIGIYCWQISFLYFLHCWIIELRINVHLAEFMLHVWSMNLRIEKHDDAMVSLQFKFKLSMEISINPKMRELFSVSIIIWCHFTWQFFCWRLDLKIILSWEHWVFILRTHYFAYSNFKWNEEKLKYYSKFEISHVIQNNTITLKIFRISSFLLFWNRRNKCVDFERKLIYFHS